jgi:uncharacterized protein
MVALNPIHSFFAFKDIAIVGVSRSGRGFGYLTFKHLLKAGYNVLPVNPNATDILGIRCYRNLTELRNIAKAVIIVVPPQQALNVVRNAIEADIKSIWFQTGSESAEAMELCERHKIHYINKECILMHAEPVVSVHKFHRSIRKIMRRFSGMHR